MQIGSVLKELKVDYPVRGALHVVYDLSGAGNTMAAIPKSLNGTLAASLHHGWIGTGLLDLAGLSLPAWLLTRTSGSDQANLVCLVAPFKFNKGRGVTHGLVLETKNVQVVGVGFIDFRKDTIDLRFKPRALHEQFIKIVQPFAIAGTLSKPHLRLTGHPVAGAVTDVLAFPFNLLETIVQPEGNEPGRVPCHVVHPTAHRGGGSGEIYLGPLKLPVFGGGH